MINDKSSLFTLGGIAGIFAGLLILAFAIISESKGVLFVQEALSGGSIENWLKNIIANSSAAKFLIILPILGFSSMLVLGITLHQITPEISWQKNLSIAGYMIGVPVVVSAFVAHLSLINELIQLSAQSSELGSNLELYATFAFHRWMVINDFVGPFFIIIIGHTLIAWAAYKSTILPKWMMFWAVFNGSLLLLSFLYPIFPVLVFGGIGGPLSMLWLIVLGVILLRKTKANN
ncbi:MAG: DUF4386 family protein [Saprospiraceae bacterium]